MPGQIAIVAALPREVRGLVGRVRSDAALASRGISLYRMNGAVVAAAGMGPSRVSLAVEAALSGGGVMEILSVGLAGACGPAITPGSVVEAGLVVDVRTGERFAAATGDGPVLVSAEAIASVGEKARLHLAYGAGLVDMEAATVARLARAHGLRFRAIKGVSDAHDFELASLARFSGKQGQFRTAAFAVHTALRPTQWKVAAALGANSKRALASLTLALEAILQNTQK